MLKIAISFGLLRLTQIKSQIRFPVVVTSDANGLHYKANQLNCSLLELARAEFLLSIEKGWQVNKVSLSTAYEKLIFSYY